MMKKGYITIYFAMIFMVLISFVLSVFEGIKVHSEKLKSECAFSTASNSVLGEYHKELLEMFDLFYVDTTYQTDVPDYHYVEAHMWEYLNQNLIESPLSVELKEISMATDGEGTGFRKQISDYVKDRIGISYIEDLQETYLSVKNIGYSEEENLIDNYLENDVGISDETWKKTQIYCPIDDLNTVKKSFVLNQVIEKGQNISNKTIYLPNYASQREHIVGTGKKTELSFVDKLYFTQYALEKFQNYTKDEMKHELMYEIEYLISGKDNDYDNLSETVKKLLSLRELFNLAYLVTDTEKMSSIQEFSLLVATLVCCPELEPILTSAIVGIWSYQESLTDVKKLLKKEKVPLVKTKNSWNTDLDDMFSMTFAETETTKEGLDYEEYLRILMLFCSDINLTYRSMDLIEMNIRETENNDFFRMDACADNFTVQILFDISMFGSYQIVRKFGYDF